MEENVKNHVLTYSKGLSSVPSDLVCDDDSLEVCENMTLVDGEWKVVQKPEGEFTLDGELMLVHRPNGAEIGNYIYKKQESNEKWKLYVKGNSTALNGEYSEITSVVAIGNTLVVNTGDKLNYFLYDANESCGYKQIGDIPDPIFDFKLDGEVKVKNEDSCEGILYEDGLAMKIIVGQEDAYNNLTIGLHAKCKNDIRKEGAFYAPFFARIAFELYNGDYYKISQPILLLPSFNTIPLSWFPNTTHMRQYLWGQKLKVKVSNDLSDWKDIIKGYSVFISKEVDLFDTTGDQPLTNKTISGYVCNSVNGENGDFCNISFNQYAGGVTGTYCECLRKFSNDNLIEKMKKTSLFYHILDIGTTETGAWIDIADRIDDNTLLNLVSRKRIENEDFYSYCNLFARDINTFNRRLNIYGVKRGFFNGFTSLFKYKEPEYATYNTAYAVYIKSPSLTERVIVNTFISKDRIFDYFYYPDPRAYKVDLFYKENDDIWRKYNTLELEEHSGLNGAIHLSQFPTGDESREGDACNLPGANNTPETLNNYLLQSEVDNPFVFNSSGYVRVGQGEIIGLAGLTTALSQDAYKVATTIAFTTQGIWALQIDATGQYSQVTPPFSREVCTNTKSITMVDNAVFFVSEKGLMCITGTTEQGVICVSKQLHGNKTFMNFLLECEIAYDYTDNMLLLYNTGSANGWVYNIENGVWSVFRGSLENKAFKTAVADYPDYLVQNADYRVFSLMEEQYRVDDVNVYSGKMVTRPLKLDGSMFLKSLRQVKNMKVINNGGISVVIKCSNDLRNWKRMESIKGQAFKFFKIEYTFTNIKAVDSFAGTAVASQVRYTEKFR